MYVHTKIKVPFRHMCQSVIYERAPGLTPQRGPLHAVWLWVLCAIPPLGSGLSYTQPYITHTLPFVSSELF